MFFPGWGFSKRHIDVFFLSLGWAITALDGITGSLYAGLDRFPQPDLLQCADSKVPQVLCQEMIPVTRQYKVVQLESKYQDKFKFERSEIDHSLTGVGYVSQRASLSFLTFLWELIWKYGHTIFTSFLEMKDQERERYHHDIKSSSPSSSSSSSAGLITTGGWVGLGAGSWASVLRTPRSWGLAAVGGATGWGAGSSCCCSSFLLTSVWLQRSLKSSFFHTHFQKLLSKLEVKGIVIL